METFWKLYEKSVITSSVVALLMVTAACYMAVNQITAPDHFTVALGLIIGFFFGAKQAKADRDLDEKLQAYKGAVQ